VYTGSFSDFAANACRKSTHARLFMCLLFPMKTFVEVHFSVCTRHFLSVYRAFFSVDRFVWCRCHDGTVYPAIMTAQFTTVCYCIMTAQFTTVCYCVMTAQFTTVCYCVMTAQFTPVNCAVMTSTPNAKGHCPLLHNV